VTPRCSPGSTARGARRGDRWTQRADNPQIKSCPNPVLERTTRHRDEHRGQLNPDCTGVTIRRPGSRSPGSIMRLRDSASPASINRWSVPSSSSADRSPAGRRSRLCPVHRAVVCAVLRLSHRYAQREIGRQLQFVSLERGWKIVNTVNFDHSKTRYPLEGKHLSLECHKCHGAGQAKQV